jgi:hypothetical protein
LPGPLATGVEMRNYFILMVVALCMPSGSPLRAEEKLTPSTLPDFLTHYNSNFPALDAAYSELANEQLPLRDESGQPVGRRPIEDRRQALADLTRTARQLAANPQDLVLTATLMLHTENLADDLFDLSQIAFDNDLEDLGKRLSDLQITMDHNQSLLSAYLLGLAQEKEDRIHQLEKENAELEQKLKEAAKPSKPVGSDQ